MMIIRHVTIFFVLINALYSYASLPPYSPDKKAEASQGNNYENNNQASFGASNLSDDKKKIFDKASIAGMNNVINLYGTNILLGDLFDIDVKNSASDELLLTKLRAVNQFGQQKISIVEPQPLNIQIGQALDHIPYIKRKLVGLTQFTPLPASMDKNGITPETIAAEISSGTNLLSIIQGAEGSGKTVFLKQIVSNLRAESHAAWTIAVDLNSITIPPEHNWHPNDIFREFLGDDYPFFTTLLAVNPINVNILLDNIDRVPVDKAPFLFQFIEKLVKKRVGVVLTTTHKLINWYPGKAARFALFKIPELSFAESKLYLTKMWIQKYSSAAGGYYKDYAHVLTDLIKRSEIPLYFHTVRLVSDLVAGDRGDHRSISDNKRNQAFYTDSQFYNLDSYSNHQIRDVQNLQETFNRIRLNKLYIYEKIIRQSKLPIEYYNNNEEENGLLSLQQKFSEEPQTSLISIELNTALSNLENAKRLGGYVPPYIEYFRSPFRFEPYDDYFALRYLLNNFPESSFTPTLPMSNVLTAIFSIAKYSKLLDLIDSAIPLSADYMPAIKHICGVMAHSATSIGWHKIMDNLLSTGMDNLASIMVDTLSYNPAGFSEYFGKSLENQPKIPFAAVNRIGSSKSLLKTPCTRQEMIFRNNMVSTIAALKKLPKDTILSFRTVEEYQSILREYLISNNQLDSGIYLEIRKAMMKNTGQTQIPTALSNKLLYHVLDNCGTTNLYIANHLVNSGAKPAQINYYGKTLVHLAVRDLSLTMLGYVVRTLKVPIPRGPGFKPILLTLLDTNPVKRYSPPRFWAVTQFLLSHGEIEVPPLNHPALSTVIPNPTSQDQRIVAYKVMTASNYFDQSMLLKLVSELNSMPFPFKSMSHGVRNLRRNIVLTRNIDGIHSQTEPKTLTEILMNYKGFSRYTPEERLTFQNAILKAIDQDCPADVSLSETKQIGLVSSIINNAVFEDDVTIAHKALKHLLFRVNNKQALVNVIKAELQNSQSYVFPVGSDKMEKQILQTNVEYYLNKEEQKKPKDKLSNLMDETLNCLHARRRRRSPMDCYGIFDDEIDADVHWWMKEIEENGEKIRVIDSDKFVDVIKDAWDSDRLKYSKLMEIARKMIKEDGIKIVGNLISHVHRYLEREENAKSKMTSALHGLDNIRPPSREQPPNLGQPHAVMIDHSPFVPSRIDGPRLLNVPLITHSPVELFEQHRPIATVGNPELYRYNPHEPLPSIDHNVHYESLPHSVIEMPPRSLPVNIPEAPVAKSSPGLSITGWFRRIG